MEKKKRVGVWRFFAIGHPSTYFLMNFGSCNPSQGVCVCVRACI